jgi:hypothetical protein
MSLLIAILALRTLPQSPVRTRTPTMYLDFKLDPGAHMTQPVTESIVVYTVQTPSFTGVQWKNPSNLDSNGTELGFFSGV